MEAKTENTNRIQLSHFTKALLDNFNKVKTKSAPSEYSRLTVSQTASFFAILYERIRNVVEYRETHLIRRAAIERILRRRLLLNSSGRGEGENLVRELLWARYFSQDALGTEDVEKVQNTIDKFITFKPQEDKHNQFLFDLLTCEIEEMLSPDEARMTALETFFIFQVLKNKIKVDGIEDQRKDAFFYVALEKIFNKSDVSYLRYNLYKLLNEPTEKFTLANEKEFDKIDALIFNPYSDRMRRFVKTQMAPFKILFALIRKEKQTAEQVLSDKEQLWHVIDRTCQEKYAQTSNRLRGLAIKAIIYIFITKMILALILEYPVSLYLFGEVNYTALVINTLFPPLLMFLTVGLAGIPGTSNTKRIYERTIDIIDKDRSYEKKVTIIIKKAAIKRPSLILAFSIFYLLTFIVTFYLLYGILSLLNFNILSQLIFVFFVSLVAFFAYRIRNISKEYRLRDKESFFKPFTDFFFIPFLTIGKYLSRSLSKLNFIATFLDFLVEAPFKLLVEVIEEWVNFIRARKEEIV